MLQPGTLLSNRYRIQDILGQGGMGAVYLAEAEALGGKKVAVKEMIPWGLPTEELRQAVAQFKKEAAFLANLDHPNLVRVTDFFVEDGKHYLVMAYIKGTTLQEKLTEQRKPFHWFELSPWADRLLDVLEYLHTQDPPILFRDLKPSNIMVSDDGCLHLIDFGIARVASSGQKTTTFLQGTGTRGFSPIEQYGDRMSTDERSDIYSLGATLYYLMCGKLPPDAVERVSRRKKIVPLSSLELGVPAGLDEILRRAMAISADDRYQNIAELRTALLGLDPQTELHVPLDTSVVPFGTRADLSPSMARPTRQSGRSWKGWMSAAGCLLLTGGLLLSFRSEVSTSDLAVSGKASDSMAVAFGSVAAPRVKRPVEVADEPESEPEISKPLFRRVVQEEPKSPDSTQSEAPVARRTLLMGRRSEPVLSLDSYPKAVPVEREVAVVTRRETGPVSSQSSRETVVVAGLAEQPPADSTTTTTEQTGPTQPVQAPIYVMPPESTSGFGYDGSSASSGSSAVYETSTQWASRGQTVDPTQSAPSGGPSLTNLASSASPSAVQALGKSEPPGQSTSQVARSLHQPEQSGQKGPKAKGGGDNGGTSQSGGGNKSKSGSSQPVAKNDSPGGGKSSKSSGSSGGGKNPPPPPPPDDKNKDGGGGGGQQQAPPPPPPPPPSGGGKGH